MAPSSLCSLLGRLKGHQSQVATRPGPDKRGLCPESEIATVVGMGVLDLSIRVTLLVGVPFKGCSPLRPAAWGQGWVSRCGRL